LFNACEVLPSDLKSIEMNPTAHFSYRQQVLAEARGMYPGDLMRQAMYSDHHTFLCSILDRNDRMTMGASIECRVPFLDYRLVETLAAMPSSILLAGRRNKHVLRRAVGNRLPEAVTQGRKWGFAVPWGSYFRQDKELRDMIRRLPDLNPICEGPFNRARLKSAINEFLDGDGSREGLIRQFFMIAVWHQACFTHTSARVDAVA
jgi:asparagine synthase (glutamine-hydrolysing)